MPSNYQSKTQYDSEVPSATGLYINMMKTDEAVYVPQYNLPEDKEVVQLLSQYTDKKLVPINVKQLSTLGGSINCLTWYCPKRLLPK
ncbi:agmatine deiminase family protein [Companilactobacillus sp. DQM5]|uniref:agmatine deiminase family protein n=1 Tax=Companilactobacillus sp. DQM5 TaxID=3463359 RepID=UPI00405A061D